MRGRWQALMVAIVTIISGYFFWIGTAVVALVTLRKGWKEGFVLLLWCALPASAQAYYQSEFTPLACLPGCYAAALILRSLVSWPAVLATTLASGLLTAGLLSTLGQTHLNEFIELYRQFFTQVQAELAKEGNQQSPLVALELVTVPFVAGIFGVIATLMSSVSLILARYWQACLYNPGGFRSEFHQLRLPPLLATGLTLAVILLAASNSTYGLWSVMFAIPLLFAGIALVHFGMAAKNANPHWLGLFYGLLLVVDPLKMLVAILALLDSWFNLRARLPKPDEPGNGQNP